MSGAILYRENGDPIIFESEFREACDRVLDKVQARAKFKEPVVVYIPRSGVVRASTKISAKEIPEWRIVGVYRGWEESFSSEGLYGDIVSALEEIGAQHEY